MFEDILDWPAVNEEELSEAEMKALAESIYDGEECLPCAQAEDECSSCADCTCGHH